MAEDEVGNIISECGQSLTAFLGGAGMRGGYNDEFMVLLSEAGICNPRWGNYAGLWGILDDQGMRG